MTTLLLATRSHHKAREISHILAPVGIRMIGLDEVGIPFDPAEDAIEAFPTFRANAVAKARWFAERAGRVAVADDSGLRVHALGGRPGVHTKRFSGRDDLQGEALDRANNERLLAELEDTTSEDRGAHYVCCAAIAWPDGRALATVGTVTGSIAREPRGDAGFGYDPLFHVPGLGARFAEVAAATKNAMSHRARAFRAAAAVLARSPWPLT